MDGSQLIEWFWEQHEERFVRQFNEKPRITYMPDPAPGITWRDVVARYPDYVQLSSSHTWTKNAGRP